eukprot:gene35625-43207_t
MSILSSQSILLALCMLALCSAFFHRPRAVVQAKRVHSPKLSMAILDESLVNRILPSLLTAVSVETKPDDYVYGAVAAPGWVLPVGCLAVILTAAIPILLRPGESALEQQRKDEATVGSEFNKRKNKDLL